MQPSIFHINAFTDKPFSGNPAAICILDTPQEKQWMQRMAQEMNQPVTAFIFRRTNNLYDLHWFTPTTELDLCGHGTLGSAHVLWQQDYLTPDKGIQFYTKSGLLTVKQVSDGIQLDFPANPPVDAEVPAELKQALGIPAKHVAKNSLGYILEVESEEIVKKIQPNFELLSFIPVTGVIVTSPSSYTDFDFVSRYFAPRIGINEDPVTGSAHCGLGPYWSAKLQKKKLIGYQASSRGGIVKLELRENQVLLTGQAITILEGKVALPL
ncbi:PhzF family phenazine biosynthesis protein [Aneurinibacillus sp. Ricciae_BoGa-3]|uniref:PhzF family phenazine biosynthesis protein n=1 Tax=Aneurinibacillus sp. Ricciae_BoGa-3 TaxID=3022697 RepID=UPI0023427728|nr:PhzF family phenazine biosynthesis protein [Aneurinibacillus sp. Ricciae_BoGa-3]WCK56765.1 PhzF family phenazine biosynthesis protein [Aneurinibacillus sp. Ricciae_BoGa-3]